MASAAPQKNNKKTVLILPLITFYDVSRDATYNWWSETETDSLEAQKHSRQLLSFLGQNREGQIQYLDPYKSEIRFRKNLEKTNLSPQELLEICKSLNAQLVLTGDVVIEESPIIVSGKRLKIQLKLLRTPQFNEIAESVRVFDLHGFEYLQLVDNGGDAWTDLHDAIDKKIKAYDAKNVSQKIELIVNGSLNRQQLSQFEDLLKAKIEGVQTVSQSYLEPGSSGIFVEYKGADGSDLSRELRALKWAGFMTQVVSSSPSQVIFDVHPQSAVK